MLTSLMYSFAIICAPVCLQSRLFATGCNAALTCPTQKPDMTAISQLLASALANLIKEEATGRDVMDFQIEVVKTDFDLTRAKLKDLKIRMSTCAEQSQRYGAKGSVY